MRKIGIAALLFGIACTSVAHAQQGGDEDLPAVQLSGAGVELLKLGVPRAEGDSDGSAAALLSKDMDITGLFQVLDPTSFPAQLQSEGLNFSSALWSQVGAQAVVKMKVSGGTLDGRAYVVARGDTAVLSKTYRAANVRDAVPSSRTTSSSRSPASPACSARGSRWR